DLIGRLLLPFLARADVLLFNHHLERGIADRRRVKTQVRLRSRNLPTVPFEVISTPMDDGRTCQCAFLDLSQFKRAEERLSLLAAVSRQLQSSFSVLPNLAA